MSDQTKAQLDEAALSDSDAVQADTSSGDVDSRGASGASKKQTAKVSAVGWMALAVAVATAGASAWLWKDSRKKVDAQDLQLTTRLFERDEVAKESLLVSKQAHQAILSLQGKVDVLEGKFSDALTQQAALRTMYQELTRGDDERLIAEVEHAVNLAAQQLAFSGDVPVALAALQSADDRLARSAQSQFVALRKVLNQDMERLKVVPIVDIPGLALKTENIVDAADSMPLAYEEKPRPAAPVAEEAERPGWQNLFLDVWRELKQLIRVERVDRLEPVAILPPENAFILRENLKLRLVNARLALLQRDTKTFKDDIRQARAWIERYFDPKAKQTTEALATLDQLASAEVRLELPKLDATLTALRSTKVNRGTAASLAAATLPPSAGPRAAAEAPAKPPAAEAQSAPAAAAGTGTPTNGAPAAPPPAAAAAKTAEAADTAPTPATEVR